MHMGWCVWNLKHGLHLAAGKHLSLQPIITRLVMTRQVQAWLYLADGGQTGDVIVELPSSTCTDLSAPLRLSMVAAQALQPMQPS